MHFRPRNAARLRRYIALYFLDLKLPAEGISRGVHHTPRLSAAACSTKCLSDLDTRIGGPERQEPGMGGLPKVIYAVAEGRPYPSVDDVDSHGVDSKADPASVAELMSAFSCMRERAISLLQVCTRANRSHYSLRFLDLPQHCRQSQGPPPSLFSIHELPTASLYFAEPAAPRSIEPSQPRTARVQLLPGPKLTGRRV